VLEPWRIALALIHDAAPEHLDSYIQALLSGELNSRIQSEMLDRVQASSDPLHTAPTAAEVQLVIGMLDSKTSLVPSSALGRLLDGTAALLGVCLHTTYEGQAPMELEALLSHTESEEDVTVPPSGNGSVIDWRPLVHSLLKRTSSLADCSSLVHKWVAHSFFGRVLAHQSMHHNPRLLATGGCLQNSTIKSMLAGLCRESGLDLITHRDVPPGDGGLALGVLKIVQHQVTERL
jgi:hydrogenase maturation protein HypF